MIYYAISIIIIIFKRLEDLAAAKFCQVYGEDSIEFDNLDYKIKSLIKK